MFHREAFVKTFNMIVNLGPKVSKKMINNFSQLREMLDFSDPLGFYFLQIFKRRKDIPELERDMIHLRDYFITSLEQFDRLESRIIEECDRENARAYLRLNRRNAKKISFQVLKKVVDYISSENYGAVKNVFPSSCGEINSETDRKWIVDIDWKDWINRAEIEAVVIPLLEELQEECDREPLAKMIPTKNGIHIITRPFNLEKFCSKYPKVDVHKDNPTILYCA